MIDGKFSRQPLPRANRSELIPGTEVDSGNPGVTPGVILTLIWFKFFEIIGVLDINGFINYRWL